MRKDRSRLVTVSLFSLPQNSATATEHARNAHNRQLWSTRNRLRLRPVAGFLPVQQLDFETLLAKSTSRADAILSREVDLWKTLCMLLRMLEYCLQGVPKSPVHNVVVDFANGGNVV